MRTILLLLIFIAFSGNASSQSFTLLKDINATPSHGYATPAPLGMLGNNLIFWATTLTKGTEIWKTDGTASGTILLKDIFVGKNNSADGDWAVMNGQLFFTAIDGIAGWESGKRTVQQPVRLW